MKGRCEKCTDAYNKVRTLMLRAIVDVNRILDEPTEKTLKSLEFVQCYLAVAKDILVDICPDCL